MIIETRAVGPFAENWYIVACEQELEALVIDPGAGIQELLSVLQEQNLKLKCIANTHGHVDHVAGVKELQESTGALFLLHHEDKMFLESFNEKTAMFGLDTIGPPKVDGELNDGDELKIGNLLFKVIHTPGHSPGGVAFFCENKLFVGDTLFQGSIGRTDFPGGDYKILINSIKEKLFPLGDEVEVFTGHGPSTTIGIEKVHNPFLNGQYNPSDGSILF